MKYFLYFSAFFVVLSCARPPELDNVPNISFENIAFREVPNEQDELILDIYFEDGDGNLGLHPEETYPPYNERLEITDNLGDYYTYPASDTFPEYNVSDWLIRREVIGTNTTRVIDTIYAPLNPNHFNIFVNFYTFVNGNKVLFDFTKELNIRGYDGRFPILFDDIENDRALEGNLRYLMKSSGWLNTFSIDSLQLEVHIQDRALNKSNTITTPKFTLLGIQIN